MMGMILESTKEMGEYSVEVRRESFYLRGMDGSRHHITVYPHTDRPVSAGTVEILTEDIPKLRACLDAIEDYLEGK